MRVRARTQTDRSCVTHIPITAMPTRGHTPMHRALPSLHTQVYIDAAGQTHTGTAAFRRYKKDKSGASPGGRKRGRGGGGFGRKRFYKAKSAGAGGGAGGGGAKAGRGRGRKAK